MRYTPAEEEQDLFWFAINYRTAGLHSAQGEWIALEAYFDKQLQAAFDAGRASREAEVEDWKRGSDAEASEVDRLTKEVEALRADAEKWKEIAMQLGQRVNFAITHLDGKGSAMMNIETGTLTGWREYLAEGMEMIPGVTIDKEMLSVLSLPKSKQKAAREKIKAARKEKQDD